MENKEKITKQLKGLIAKGNRAINASQNKQQVTAYLYIILSFLALSLFGLFAIGPTITTITTLNQEFDEGRIALKELQDKNSALTSLSTQYAEIESELPLITNAIPETSKVSELTRQLEVLATRNNLVLQKLDIGLMELYPAKNLNSPIFSFTFSLNVEGTEKDVNTFIANTINMGRIIGIDQLTTGKRQDNVYTASITGRAFFYHEQPVVNDNGTN